MFNKTRGEEVGAANVEADKMKKAEEIYKKLNVFGNISGTAK